MWQAHNHSALGTRDTADVRATIGKDELQLHHLILPHLVGSNAGDAAAGFSHQMSQQVQQAQQYMAGAHS